MVQHTIFCSLFSMCLFRVHIQTRREDGKKCLWKADYSLNWLLQGKVKISLRPMVFIRGKTGVDFLILSK